MKKKTKKVKALMILRPNKHGDIFGVNVWTPYTQNLSNKAPQVFAICESKKEAQMLFKHVKRYEQQNKLKGRARYVECTIIYSL